MMYTDETPAESNDLDIFLRFSDDNGLTWSIPVRVNDDATTNTQMLPHMAIDQTTGIVAIGFYDARNDIGGGSGDTNGIPNDDVQFWATVTRDGGLTFDPNIQVSAGTSNSASIGNPNDFGDYTYIAFQDGAFYPIWADNSTAIAGNPGRPQPDLVTAHVEVSPQLHVSSGPAPGDWRGIVISEFANDRNVDVINEVEPAYTGSNDTNNLPSKARFLGTLAADEKNGDDTRRLGFEVHGVISFDRPGDVDVYSFNGTAGTEIWLDIDRTSVSLDTVLELIDANGAVLARSNNSFDELGNPSLLVGSPTVKPMTMNKTAFSGEDLYSTNPKDAGMRLVLPGVVGTSNTYYVRMRSSSANLANPVGGQTSGAYQLQIRLRELNEVPGSTVRYSDIRYATTGIEVLGGPSHSPLTGEIGRAPLINAINGFDPLFAQDLGNLLATDRNAISLSSRQETFDEVQWYKFTLDYQSVQAIRDYNDGNKTFPVVFDIDYADGISRPDLTLSLFEEVDPTVNGLKLVAVARSSSIVDDQPAPLSSKPAADLTRGSFGKFDPFLGSIQLTEGTLKTYYVAIASDAMLPTVLAALNQAEPPNKLKRLEPTNSVQRSR